jgi:hypothetical protein
MEPDIKALQDIQSRLVFLSHSFRQADNFDVSQHLSDAGERIGKAIRSLELSKQATTQQHGEGRSDG